MIGIEKCSFPLSPKIIDLISMTEKLSRNQIEILFKEEITDGARLLLDNYPIYITAASRIMNFIPQIIIVNKSKFDLTAFTHELFHLYLYSKGIWSLHSTHNEAAKQFSLEITNTIDHIIFFHEGEKIGIDFYSHQELSLNEAVKKWPMTNDKYVRFIDGIRYSLEMNFLTKDILIKEIWRKKAMDEDIAIVEIADIIINKIKNTNFDNSNESNNLYRFIVDKIRRPNINLNNVFQLFRYDFINKRIVEEYI